jgi:hypothetical protein
LTVVMPKSSQTMDISSGEQRSDDARTPSAAKAVGVITVGAALVVLGAWSV